ncbi:helix-turn-helix domain-containing protein [Hoeflea sp.]|uniref:AraC family transcriptional regulator n=1 Tax=Hoeflea sp. TaxID=1940281 RepID=UPI003B027F0E
MNTHWSPASDFRNTYEFLFDSVQEDFEQQAARYKEIDLNCIQLSSGKFRGRITSALLGDISIYAERNNQTMEREFSLPPGMCSFCVALDGSEPADTYGVANSGDVVYITPPGGRSVTICPADTALLVFTIDHEAFMRNAGLLPGVADWFAGLGRRGTVVRSARLAHRLRADITSALQGSERATSDKSRAAIDRATVLSVANALTMEWLTPDKLKTFPSTHAYERFRTARNLLLDDASGFDIQGGRSYKHLGSKRSIEQAFNDHVFMGPLTYRRIVRLHHARRKLLDPERRKNSIGDIAAEEGFWDASRFANFYRRHFGELPSETRFRLAN